jgi:hypothetical protein
VKEILMRKYTNALITIGILICPIYSFGIDTKEEERTCSEIGFKKKTEAHADCVLELLERKQKLSSKKESKEISKAPTSQESPNVSPAKPQAVKGDGSADDLACVKFGFIVGTQEYANCRLQMDTAKRQAQQKQAEYELTQRQYEHEMRAYQERVAAYEKEKERQKGEALMKFGLSLMGGSSPYLSENLANASRASLGMPPIQPVQPRLDSFMIRSPGGAVTSCFVTGNVIQCR